jgi:hypothetical protein
MHVHAHVHDNVPSHLSAAAVGEETKFHSPSAKYYSQDFILFDTWLFPTLKTRIKGYTFLSVEEI